jgi:hypothetical protein
MGKTLKGPATINKENTMSKLFNRHDQYERDSRPVKGQALTEAQRSGIRRIRPYACTGAQFKDGAPIRTTPRGMDASEFINTTTECYYGIYI